MQSSAARASLWWDEQHQSRKMIGVKDFRVVPDSLMLQSFLWANLFEIFFSLFTLFFASQSAGMGALLGLFLTRGQTTVSCLKHAKYISLAKSFQTNTWHR